MENNLNVTGFLAGMSPMKSGVCSPSKVKTRNGGTRVVQSRFFETNTSLRKPGTASQSKRFANTMKDTPAKEPMFNSSVEVTNATSPNMVNQNMASTLPQE
jgi:hypothetical protein